MMEENNSLCCLFLGIFYAILSSFVYTGVRLWNKFSERYENEEPPKKVIRKKPVPVLSKKVKKIRRNVKNRKPKPKRKVPASSTEASEDEDYKAPSRSPSKSKNFHPDKKKTIKSIEIEKNFSPKNSNYSFFRVRSGKTCLHRSIIPEKDAYGFEALQMDDYGNDSDNSDENEDRLLYTLGEDSEFNNLSNMHGTSYARFEIPSQLYYKGEIRFIVVF